MSGTLSERSRALQNSVGLGATVAPESGTPQSGAPREIDRAAVDIYKEICANIRTTDDISFKLLGIVPLGSGLSAGVLTLLEKESLTTLFWPPIVLVLSLLGAVVVFALLRWELRNSQKCNWLIDRAGQFERGVLGKGEHPGAEIQFDEWSVQPKPRFKSLRNWPWGKTEAEEAIYCAAIAMWLTPAVIAALRLLSTR